MVHRSVLYFSLTEYHELQRQGAQGENEEPRLKAELNYVSKVSRN